MENKNYDLIIIGGGPAGTSAGVYAARKRLKTLLLTETIGGQSVVSTDIHNWIGTNSISGSELALSFESHLKKYSDDVLEIKKGEIVNHIEKKSEETFEVQTNSETYLTKTILITTGSKRKKLNITGAEEFENKGIVYCASCDGPMFAGQDVVVVGGGNAGFESASQLLVYAKSVTLLNRTDKYRADKIIIEKVLAHPNMTVIPNVEIAEIRGDKFVESIIYKDKNNEEEFKEIKATGIFVEIGSIPITSFAKDIIELNEREEIIIDPRNQKTSMEGIWAAGDCTNGLYHQNNIAAGDAVKALEDIYLYLVSK